MKVGDIDIEWDMGWQAASEVLTAIHILATTQVRKLELDDFTAYKVGEQIRIDVKPTFYKG